MKSVCYWCPYISKVATVRSVIKSAESLKKYSNDQIEPIILNVAGEWNQFKEDENKFKIKIVNLTNSKILDGHNWTGFFRSRIIYIFVFFISFFPTLFFLKKRKPDYFLVHLISSLPLFLNLIFKFNSKIILRISGMPKMNIYRKFLWNLALKKIFLVTSPTRGTHDDLNKLLSIKNKIKTLYDPIITSSEIVQKKKEKIDIDFRSDYFIAIGRLTRQKNFEFLIYCFKEIISKNKNIKLLIIGEGELKEKLANLIDTLDANNNITILPFKKNVYNYLYNAKAFILSSLWEDPGFVLVEASYLNVPIISSNCKNGPEEILEYGKNGILFESNNQNSFIKNFNLFNDLNQSEIYNFKLNAKKYIRRFTDFAHYNQLINILEKKI